MARRKGPAPAPPAAAAAAAAPAPAQAHSADAYLQRAVALMDQFQVELAERFAERAVATDGGHVGALETLAGIKLELDKPDEARQLLERAVAVAPEQGHSKYMSLAQLQQGHDALRLLHKGVALLAPLAGAGEEAAAGESVARQLSSAYCAMIELYLTDLCFDEDAEARAEEYAALAQQWDPSNPEPYQCLASVRLSQQNNAAAAALMHTSLAMWLTPALEARAAAAAHATEGDEEEPPVDTTGMPSFEHRMSTAKLLIELAEYERALDVIETMMVDDDEVVQVWYLCGYTHYLARKLDESVETFQHGLELYTKTQCDDEELLASMEALLAEVQEELQAAAPAAAPVAKRKSAARKARAPADDDQMDV